MPQRLQGHHRVVNRIFTALLEHEFERIADAIEGAERFLKVGRLTHALVGRDEAVDHGELERRHIDEDDFLGRRVVEVFELGAEVELFHQLPSLKNLTQRSPRARSTPSGLAFLYLYAFVVSIVVGE